MAIYKCEVCDYIYDEDKEGVKWADLPDDWVCPVCESEKSEFVLVEEESKQTDISQQGTENQSDVNEFLRKSDDFEINMADIHKIANSGKSIIEAMRTKKPTFSWDDILFKGAQLAKIPLNHEDPVNTQTIIGPDAKQPLVIESPLFVTHMSFGALSKESKLALAKGSAAVKTAMCSGEGGIFPESMESAYKYIFEYVPNKYSVSDENLKKVDAIEIKIGQSAKPGMGGHLPGDKVTKEIAKIRGFEEGADIFSPSHFSDIKNKNDLKTKIEWLREASEGKPIGTKIAAGNIEIDLEEVIFANPDFVTIDGRAGATAAAPKFVKDSTSVPTIFALYRARKFLDDKGRKNISLIITGSLRISPDFAKALALGADAIALGTSTLMAIGCQQYRICNTGKCPMGIATQDEELRKRLNVEHSAKQLENYLNVSTEELKTFARLTGSNDVHKLSESDICTTNTEISNHTSIEHV
jgi:methylamine---glutamate N-methyltransferase subunit C